ncbi:uncharacterized protein LOC132697465 [Cylas formicarius]|uniref:uncharacterized protein LOC132697465 n=1 Tax=Cylas formicarius TaxID=197179 RepID=UPI002958D24E|nr:uncharacterized protein LOC132697465 [Cylas formicarius]
MGSTATETMLVILPSYFYLVISVLIASLTSPRNGFKLFLTEFCIIVIPIILSTTILAHKIVLIITALSILVRIILLYVWTIPNMFPINQSKYYQDTGKRDYVTNIRATINVITVVAILAVDFKIFPSRFSKTHTVGFSLMDTGVGLYVFANGIVSPEVKSRKESIRRTLKTCGALTVLGFIRFLSTKVLGYHVSVIEYGLHWNFFLTLAVTKMLSTLILRCVRVNYVYIVAAVLTCFHETLLQFYLKKYVFSTAKRDGLISANREGLVSILGFVDLYLYSVYFGYTVFKSEHNKLLTHAKLIFAITLTLILTNTFDQWFEVSRRIASAGYIFWILFIAISMSYLFYLNEELESFVFTNKIRNYVCAPLLFEAINFNGLAFFLIGNVLTGLVNMTFDTREAAAPTAILVMTGYMFVSCLFVHFLHSRKIKLKF